MYIKEIFVEAFGVLKKQRLYPDRGISCYVLGNGRGKTTLTYFIKAMLFGLDDSKRSVLDNERKRYIPWDGERASGYLVIEHQGKSYRIERSFGRRASEDTLCVFDAATQTPTDALTDYPGRFILGIDQDGFERTLFISERLLSHDSSNDSVSSRLSTASGTKYDIGEYKRATLAIDNKRKSLQRRGGGEILDCRERLAAIEHRIAELRSAEIEYTALTDELERTDETIRQHLRQGESDRASLSSHADNRRTKSRNSTDSSVKGGKRVGLSILCILLLVSAIAMLTIGISNRFKWAEPYGALFICIALILCFALAFVLIKKNSRKKRHSLTDADISQPNEIYQNDYFTEMISLQNRRSELAFKRDSRRELLQNAKELSHEAAALTQRIGDLKEQLRILELTEELLTRAHESVKGKYFGSTKEAFDRYLNALGESGELTLDTSFNIKRTDGGITRDRDAYSKGKRELYSLALRLAIIDSLYDGISPPIIVDDAFSSYDDGTLALALKLLIKLSENRQIIYLTPSHARAAALVRNC